MRVLVVSLLIGSLLGVGAASAQNPAPVTPGAPPTVPSLERLTVAQCTVGYQPGMPFSQAEFDRHCAALRAIK